MLFFIFLKFSVRFTDLRKDTNTIDQEAKELRERLKIAKIQPRLIPDEMKKDILYWTPEGIDGRSRSTWREPPTMGKQLVNFITCGCESSASFFVIYKSGHEPTPYW
jgi:hypothetical protein